MKSILLAILSFFFGVSGALAAPGDYSIVNQWESPVVSPDGIEWVDGSLWLTNCETTRLTRVNPENGEVIETKNFSGIYSDHLSWDGHYMWMNQHDMGSMGEDGLHLVDLETEEEVRRITPPGPNPMGIGWDGQYVWTQDAEEKLIYKLDPDTGGVIDSFDTPGNNPCGLNHDRICLWASDLSRGKIYQIDPASGEVQLDFEVPGGNAALPTGMTWDGRYLWFADEQTANPTIYQLDLEMAQEGPCAASLYKIGGEETPEDTGGCQCGTRGGGFSFPALFLFSAMVLFHLRKRG